MITLKDAKEATDSIVKALQPISVSLFGSVAVNGTGTDLDLLIIVDEKKYGTISDARLLLHKCLKRFYAKFSIDPFIVSISLFNEYYSRGSPFLRLISKEGRALYMKNAVQEWVKQTEEELRMAEYLLKGRYLKGACYHAQQSIEKAIKARLIKKGWDLEKNHSVQRLVAIGKDHKIRFNLSEEDIIFIDGIYRGRHPIEAGLLPLGEPSKADAEKAVSIARRMFNSVQRALKR